MISQQKKVTINFINYFDYRLTVITNKVINCARYVISCLETITFSNLEVVIATVNRSSK